MEQITYVLKRTAMGTLHDEPEDGTPIPVTASLFEGGGLFQVVLEEDVGPTANIYTAVDEIRHQAVMKACMRSGAYNIFQVYQALGKTILPGGLIED